MDSSELSGEVQDGIVVWFRNGIRIIHTIDREDWRIDKNQKFEDFWNYPNAHYLRIAFPSETPEKKTLLKPDTLTISAEIKEEAK